MRPNKFRQLFQAGKPTLGTHLYTVDPIWVETVGHSGMFDYVEFVAEYGAYTLHDLDNFCRAVELFDMAAIIKIDQEPRTFAAQRAIGSGFQGVLFADVRTVEDARQCVRVVRPDTVPDKGIHGNAVRRFSYPYHVGTPSYVQALRDVMVLLMIEKGEAVERLEEILATPGIDMVQWGGVDYAMSIGHPGERQTPEIKAQARRVFETALRLGVQPRAEIGAVDQAKYYLDMGVRHFCLGADVWVMLNWWKTNGENMRKALEGA